MGFLTRASGVANFSKAVFSLWFRIPGATLTAVAAMSNTPPEGFQGNHMNGLCYFPPLYKIIPLVSFGSVETDDFGNSVQPSFIGVDCSLGQNTLACALQTPVDGVLTTEVDSTVPGRPACFYMSGRQESDPGNATIAADTWNHALISFDIGHATSSEFDYVVVGDPELTPQISSGNTFTWALNDVSKVGPSMNPAGGGRWELNGIADPSIIINDWVTDAGGYIGSHEEGGPEIRGDHVSWPGGLIAAAGNPFGIPGYNRFAANVQNVIMGPLQLYTGISINAADEGNRRAFITEDGRPADSQLARTLLNRSPVVEFRTSDDWKNGRNRGTGGSFARFGTISSYTGSPTLGGA